MAPIRTAHPIRIAIVICAVAAFPGLFLGAPAANAGVLEGLTGQVEEVVAPVVGTPTAQAVGETVTTTAHEVTAKVAPSATKAADAATSSAVGAAGASTQAADGLTDKVKKLAGGSEATAGVASAAGAATQTVEAATRSAESAVHGATAGAEDATGATLPDPSVASTAVDPVGPEVDAASSEVDPAGPGASMSEAAALADSAAAPTELPPAAARTTYVPPPGSDGSTGAPLPRWLAYVWPAVALTGPSLATLAEDWSQAIVRLATEGSAGSGIEGGVAGVHASGGQAAANSVPLFSSLPSDVASAFSSVPTPIFIYLGLLLLAVIAVGLAVKREIAAGRRW
jgi:hypothetical protein